MARPGHQCLSSLCQGILSTHHKTNLTLAFSPLCFHYLFTMGQPTWANNKQYEFLQTQGELFKVYQIDKKAAKVRRKPAPIFWQLFFQAWENQWPNLALGNLINPSPGGQEVADEGRSASSTPMAEGVTSEPSKNKTKQDLLTVQSVSNW